jgi:hypothetical protein
MTNMNQNAPKPANDTNKQAILKDIETKWDKFSQTELSALRSRDELVAQVETKYGFDKAVAQREVDAILKGRTF